MASSGANFTSAINALVAERDRVFLERVAQDYGLSYEELHSKYLETAEKAIKVPRKYTKKPKSVTVVTEGEAPVKETKEPKAKEPKAKAEKQCCTAQTSKKEPCKFSALKGEVFCKRHLKQSLGEPAAEKVPKAKEPKVKPLEPVHTHAIGVQPEGACDLCETNGDPLATEPTAFELVAPAHTGPVKVPSAAERLAAILAESEDEEEDEDDGEPQTDGDEDLAVEDYDEE